MAKIEDMWVTPGTRPNGLQAAADGLWVISADEGSHLYKLDYEAGDVIVDVPTETYRSSGLTVGGGHVWVASTHSSRLYKLNEDGSTVEFYDPPGTGVHDPRDTGPGYNRPHGMEWVDGRMWVAAKPALRLYLIDPETLAVERSIPTPGAGSARDSLGRRGTVVRGPRDGEDPPAGRGDWRDSGGDRRASTGAARSDDARGGAYLLLRSEWSGVSGGGMSPLAKSIGIFS